MDTILDELGNKWQSLAQDEKMALAQTVAGVRQYSQLIALMDNYDLFKVNVDLANNIGNLLNRTLNMLVKYFDGEVKPEFIKQNELFE